MEAQRFIESVAAIAATHTVGFNAVLLANTVYERPGMTVATSTDVGMYFYGIEAMSVYRCGATHLPNNNTNVATVVS